MSFAVWSGLLGGLALFMLGLDIMTRALKIVAGDRLRTLMARLTANRLSAVATGAAVTAAVNSSSVTTVLLVGFVSAGLMTMTQALGVVMGANIGSTMTAQIIAFDVGRLALPAVALGFLASMAGRTANLRNLGLVVLGLGLVFHGMVMMSDAMRPLREVAAFRDFLRVLDSVPLAVLAGAVFTAVVQSSAATTGIVMAMAAQGLMGLEAAIAVTLGANIGTCVTAGLAVIGKPPEAVRVFLAHLLFNVAGALLWMPLTADLAVMAQVMSVAFDAADDVGRHIANAHTLFNVANTALFIGFAPWIARLLLRLVPDRPAPEGMAPLHLNAGLLAVPAVAVGAARKETVRFGREVAAALGHATDGLVRRLGRGMAEDRPLVPGDAVAGLYALRRRILDYVGELGAKELSRESAVLATDLVQALELLNAVLEVTAAIGRPPLTEPADRASRPPVRPLPQAQATMIAGLAHRVRDDVLTAIAALETGDEGKARAVIDAKRDIHQLVRTLTEGLFRATIPAGTPGRSGFSAAMAEIERLSRVHRLARKLAKLVIRSSAGAAERGAAAAVLPAVAP